MLRGQNNVELLLGKRSNNSKDNTPVVKTHSSISVIKISLYAQPQDQLEPKG